MYFIHPATPSLLTSIEVDLNYSYPIIARARSDIHQADGVVSYNNV